VKNERNLQLKKTYNSFIEQSGKDPLIAVSKYYPFSDIQVVYDLGQRVFAESRVQDLKIKSAQAIEYGLNEIAWHFIGHLQSNKVKDLLKVKQLRAIHSIDSIKLLDELKKRESLLSDPIDIFLQINTSGESEKSGLVTVEDISLFIDHYKKLNFSMLNLAGLMTIGKVRTSNFEEDAKSCFSYLCELQKTLETRLGKELKLSMGMSSDYKWALEMGSDYIRVGSLIFG